MANSLWKNGAICKTKFKAPLEIQSQFRGNVPFTENDPWENKQPGSIRAEFTQLICKENGATGPTVVTVL